MCIGKCTKPNVDNKSEQEGVYFSLMKHPPQNKGIVIKKSVQITQWGHKTDERE